MLIIATAITHQEAILGPSTSRQLQKTLHHQDEAFSRQERLSGRASGGWSWFCWIRGKTPYKFPGQYLMESVSEVSIPWNLLEFATLRTAPRVSRPAPCSYMHTLRMDVPGSSLLSSVSSTAMIAKGRGMH